MLNNDPVWFNLCQRREIVLWWTLNCRATSVWDYPVWKRSVVLLCVAVSNLGIAAFHSSYEVTATATAAGIPSLRRIYTQTVRNRLRQRKIRPRRTYVGSVLTQVHRCASVIHLGSGLWETSAEFDSAMRVPFYSLSVNNIEHTWMQNIVSITLSR
jgi:hypothetical protein